MKAKKHEKRPAQRRKKVPDGLVKMSELARRSDVPAPTIKHYIREGLLPEPALRTSPNMAYYAVTLVPRIRKIKELQKSHFLPLRVIRDILEGEAAGPDDMETAFAIARVLREDDTNEGLEQSAAELVSLGHPAEELHWLEANGLVTPSREGDDVTYRGSDLELLDIIREARKRGINEEMFPNEMLGVYRDHIEQFLRMELEMFRERVMRNASSEQIGELAEAAVRLSERLVVHLRRKRMLPTLRELVKEEPSP